ncbi:MAG TPA: DUF6514 family protein [Oscillospiraceae bacterium]|nr:DUF6514 family protein [Oscillospiraceae bacterium]HRW56448.1 DUF6514 family protein [Oscillospiraceae bacterium]
MNYRLRERTIVTEDGIHATVWGVVFTEGETEVVYFPDISINQGLAKRFAELCLRNSVSPLHLHDVLEDFLAVND